MGTNDLTWERLIARYANLKDRYRDPVVWLEERCGEFLWSKQREIALSVRDHRYTTVQANHAAGKSFLASRLIAWWIDTHPPGTAFVVSTAPTSAQVSSILWRELTKVYNKLAQTKNPLPGQILSAGYPQWKINKELVGYGRKPADYQDSAFQGIHERYVLVIVDEAGGVPRSLWDAVDALVTNDDCRVLAIGNPDRSGTHFSQICDRSNKLGDGWQKIRIDGMFSPNMTEEACAPYPALVEYMKKEGIPYSVEQVPDELRHNLISPTWVAERIARWGVDSALFKSKVRGLFPDTNSEGIIPRSWIDAANQRWEIWNEGIYTIDEEGNRIYSVYPRSEQIGGETIGVDVSDGGEDESVIAVRQGNVIVDIQRYVPQEAMEVAAAAQRVALANGMIDPLYIVDGIGAGSGVVSKLKENMRRVVSFIASARSPRKDKTGKMDFANDRAAAWWNLRELLNPNLPGGSNVCLPPDEKLSGELETPKFTTQAGTPRYVLEKKDDIRKRLGRSTDSADAVVHAFWLTGGVVDDGELQGDKIKWAESKPVDPNDYYPERNEVGWVDHNLDSPGYNAW